jgi:LysM repeat protein
LASAFADPIAKRFCALAKTRIQFILRFNILLCVKGYQIMSHSQKPQPGRWIASLLTLGAVMAFASVTFAQRPVGAQAQSVTCASTYVVKPGDDLYRIALAAGTTWPVLQQLNGLVNPNLIFVGETLCLPTAIVPGVTPTLTGSETPTPEGTATATTTPPTGPIVLPPVGVFPSITFDRTSAAPGDTITITGVNFPTNGTADVYIKPLTSPIAYAPVAQTVTSGTGTVNFQFTIPTVVNGQPLQGNAFSVLVKERATGYFGFNFFFNSRGF